jgi:glyceraldehyde 3-phosphate dehydrogenase
MNQIPTKTGAAAAVGSVLPELDGRLDGLSIRVPTINVSCVDFTFVASRDTDKNEIDAAMNEAASDSMKDIMAVNTKPLVSSDFNHDPASCTYDATQTRVMEGTLVKVLAWYDNEWGFSNRMLDMAAVLAKAG